MNRGPATRWVVVAIVAASCGATSENVTELTVRDARTNPTSTGVDAAVLYFDIVSPQADALEAVEVEPGVGSGVVMYAGPDGQGGHDHNDASGESSVSEPLDYISLPAQTEVSFEPGGMHVMIEDLAKPLAEGDVFDIRVTFTNQPDVIVPVQVTSQG
jgi:copper(I)-binding protein